MRAIYRLYTESRDNVAALVAAAVPSASIINIQGIWEGTFELGMIVEIIGSALDRAKVQALAQTIARENGQACVLVTEQQAGGALSIWEFDADGKRDNYMAKHGA